MKQPELDEEDVQRMLEFAKRAIQAIQRKNKGLLFEEMYRNAYTMVSRKHGDTLYTCLRETIDDHLRNNVRPSVKAILPAPILIKLIEVWSDHTAAMVTIRDMLMYLDRVYLVPKKLEVVYNVGLNSFRDEVIRHNGINYRLRREMLDLILAERKGQQIDWISLKKACMMFSDLSIYGREFEQPFLKETSYFYKNVAKKLLQGNSASEYVQRVEQYLEEESRRAGRILEKETKKKLLDVVERELISNHMQTLVDMHRGGVVAMLEDKKIEDLRRMYTIFSRVDKGRMVFCNAVTRWLRSKEGRTSNPGLQSDELTDDPMLYILRVLSALWN